MAGGIPGDGELERGDGEGRGATVLNGAGTGLRRTAVDPDGWVYCCDNGEILGRAEVNDRFEVDDIDKAEWVLSIRSQLEGEIAGIEARMKAVQGQLAALRSAKLRRLAWWEWRFAPSLVAFARRQLKRKQRTAQFGWGRVKFVRTKGTTKIVDMDAAVEWMRTWNPEKVRVRESVKAGDVLAVRDDVAAAFGGEPEHLAFLKTSGGSERVTISTGIEIQSGGDSDVG